MAVFDLDGTLLNTLEDLADAVNYSLAQFGMPQRTIEEVRNYVGNGIRLLIERSVPNGTDLPVIDNVLRSIIRNIVMTRQRHMMELLICLKN